MNRRVAVILLVGIAVLGSIAYYITVNPEAAGEATPTSLYDPGSSTSSTLWTIDSTQVTSVTVSDAINGATFSASRDESGKWIVTQPYKGEADPNTMSIVASTLASLSINRTITETASLADFGLAAPDYAIEVKQNDGKVFRATIGQKAVTGSGYYVLPEGATNAVLVSSSSLDPVLGLAASPPIVTPPPPVTPETLEPLPTLPSPGTPSP